MSVPAGVHELPSLKSKIIMLDGVVCACEMLPRIAGSQLILGTMKASVTFMTARDMDLGFVALRSTR